MFWKRTFLWHVSADDDAVAPEATFPCPHCSQPVPEISMAHFSFNKPEGACPTCTGLGIIHQVTIHGARQHNLQNINVRLPPGLLIAVTGVSGSGKSSLIFDILDRTMRQRLYDASDTPGEHDTIESYAYLDKIITIDQGHIGRIPRSNAATSSETFTPIREAFAATPEARRRGLTARHFSFNVPGGHCERCEGLLSLNVLAAAASPHFPLKSVVALLV